MRICMGCMKLYEDEYEVCPYCGYIVGTPAEESYYLEPGTILDNHYVVGRVIGSGGFGVTYVGWDYELERKIAIKEYLPAECSTRIQGCSEVTIFQKEKGEQFHSGIEKFMEEAKRLVKVRNVPGIVKCYDCFEENNTAYITMEYLEGETLKEHLGQPVRKMPYPEARAVMDALLEALVQIHKAGIVHRDIAPDNIFLTTDGQVKLIDFGASRFATAQHTRSLTVLIKEGYSPKEQYRSFAEQGPWMDVYSVAATFYTMVTGKVPQDAVEREKKDRIRRPSRMGAAGIPRPVENAVMNALNRRVEDRTKNCEDFIRELNAQDTRWNIIRQHTFDAGRWPVWLKLVSSAAFLAVTVLLILSVTGIVSFQSLFSAFMPSGGVPGVVGLHKTAAEEELRAAGYKIQYANYIELESDNVTKDCIYNQTPVANARMEQGCVVYLAITCGVIPKRMVDTVGYDVQTAEKMLKELELEVQTVPVSGDAASGAAPGTVVRQLLGDKELERGNEDIKAGMVITLEVSEVYSAIDTEMDTQVPDLCGKEFTSAREDAGAGGLYIRKSGERYSDEAPDTVLEQTAASGETVKQGTVVDVVVSRGDKIQVPLLMLKSREEAQAEAERLQLQVVFEEQESETVPKGCIISQSVEAGQELHYSDRLRLIVSKGSSEIEAADGGELERIARQLTGTSVQDETAAAQEDNREAPEQLQAAESGRNSEEDSGYTEQQKEEPAGAVAQNQAVREETDTLPKSYLSGWTTDGSYATDDRYICRTAVQYRLYPYVASETELTEDNLSYVKTEQSGYTDWGAWSVWQDGKAPQASDSLVEYETQTGYRYTAYVCSICRNQFLPQAGWTDTICGHRVNEELTAYSWGEHAPVLYDSYHFIGGARTTVVYELSGNWWYNESEVYRYRSRTRAPEYVYYYRENTPTEWSMDYPSQPGEVEQRTVYRYSQR